MGQGSCHLRRAWSWACGSARQQRHQVHNAGRRGCVCAAEGAAAEGGALPADVAVLLQALMLKVFKKADADGSGQLNRWVPSS